MKAAGFQGHMGDMGGVVSFFGLTASVSWTWAGCGWRLRFSLLFNGMV